MHCLTPYLHAVYNKVLSYIKTWIPSPQVGVLAGNSIHADRSFMVNEMPGVVEWLHYWFVFLGGLFLMNIDQS